MTLIVLALGAILGTCVGYVGARRMWWLCAGLGCVTALLVALLSVRYFETHDVTNVVFFCLPCGLSISLSTTYSQWRQRQLAGGTSRQAHGPAPAAAPPDDMPTWR